MPKWSRFRTSLPSPLRRSATAKAHMPLKRAAQAAPLLVGVDDDFAVAAGAERVAGGDELVAQLAVVVDLAVVDEPDGVVLVGDGLVAPGAVDDAEPAVAEAHVRALEGAGVVGSAVHERRCHAPEELPVGRAGEAEDAAHARELSWGSGPMTGATALAAAALVNPSTVPEDDRPAERRAGRSSSG